MTVAISCICYLFI